MSDAETELLKNYFVAARFDKGAIIEKENTIVEKLYFIVEGYVRVFYQDNGDENTTQIIGKNNLITLFESFISGRIADNNMMCVTECELLCITKPDYEFISTAMPSWSLFCKTIYESVIEFNLQRTKDLITLNAEERYLQLMTQQPGIIQNVPIQYIASYIGIKPESLSRIRRKIIS